MHKLKVLTIQKNAINENENLLKFLIYNFPLNFSLNHILLYKPTKMLIIINFLMLNKLWFYLLYINKNIISTLWKLYESKSQEI